MFRRIASGSGNFRSHLRGFHFSFAARQPNERLVEVVQPSAQQAGIVMRGIGSHENHFQSIDYVLWHSSHGGSEIAHLRRADAHSVRITEEQQCDVAVGPRSEIERCSGRVDQGEAGFWQRRGHQPATVRGLEVPP